MTDGDLWDRLSPRKKAARKHSPSPQEPMEKERSTSSKRRLLIAQLIAATAWLYLVVKLFILDLDYILIASLFPEHAWALDLRIIAVAIIFITIVHFFRRYVWWIIYILAFPAILTLWHIPLKLYRLWSWDVAIALTNVAYSASRSFKASITVRVTEICCIFLVAGFKPAVLMLPLVGTLIGCMLLTYSRMFIRTFSRHSFLKAHAAFARRILQSGLVMQWASLPPAISRSRAKRLNQKQTEQVAQNLSNALLVIKASDFYAYRLARYRKSAAPYILGTLSYALIFIYTTIILTVVNIAIYKFSPAQFKVEDPFSSLAFMHYSLSSLALNGVDGISPTGNLAIALKVFAGYFGPIILATLLLNGVLSYRKDRDDEATRETIDRIKGDASKIITRVESEYEVTPSEALRRLQELGVASTIGIAIWLSAQIPENFNDDEPSSAREIAAHLGQDVQDSDPPG